jgi:general secretion pathway protein G
MICRRPTGFTLIELMVVTVIIAVLAIAVIPLAENSVQREREIELRQALRLLRTAIDEYKKFVDENKIQHSESTYGYPTKLDDLIRGIEYNDKNNKKKVIKFLRQIPHDPISGAEEWGMRSYQDKRDSDRWGGENIWDVYSLSEKKGLDGSYYKSW